MKSFEDFLAFLAKKSENQSESKPEIGGLTTSDNKNVDANLVSSIRMILAGCNESRITRLEIRDLFDRLTENFIKANTEEDIKHFVSHNVALKLVSFLKE